MWKRIWNRSVGATLALYFAVVIWMAWTVHDTVRGGSVFVAEAFGALLIPLMVGFAIAVRRKSDTPVIVAICIAALSFIPSHWSDVEEGLDARIYKREVAAATPETYFDIVHQSKSKIGRAIADMADLTKEAGSELNGALNLDDPRLGDFLTADVLKSKARRDELLAIAIGLQQRARRAGERIDGIVSATFAKADSYDYPFNEKAAMLPAFRRGMERQRVAMKQYVATYVDLYDEMRGTYQILDQDPRAQVVGDGKVLFSSQTAVDAYNAHLAAIGKDSQQLESLQAQFQQGQAQAAQKLISDAH